ncbi:sulfurtransferase [Mangrovimicrobium sediminis]|uniref:Sulfurtransferase n=1 Tax=Mangrovimicrobium sediminis TaxID=2562682 RepID=A0A4Z0M3G1_9GAMM|nr:sulfurtransferase [Haliea sp. SAOS-164]TGD73994.1 sulfurtransferase [Haliea sp. SAOS-164]
MLIDAEALASAADTPADPILVDCRFDLADPDAGRRAYLAGHIPGARYLDLNRDLSAPPGRHGGRHPLPAPEVFARTLAAHGIGPHSAVVAYDDSRFAYAARLWWIMRELGYRPPLLLDGGYRAWLAAGGAVETGEPDPAAAAAPPAVPDTFGRACDIDGLRELQARGAELVDSREAARYRGEVEPIDPVAGHIPGALNHPWQGVTDVDGFLRDEAALRAHWGERLAAPELVVYCGSGVTACVNLFSLAALGREDAVLYAGSWSDWCSHL